MPSTSSNGPTRTLPAALAGALASVPATVLKTAALAVLTVAPLFVPATLRAQDTETTRLADGVYQFRYTSHNALLVVTDDGVVVMDPLNEDAARAIAAEIERIAPGAGLAAVVYSHDHADHATGAAALMAALDDTAPIVAHRNAVPHIRERGGPAQPMPDMVFEDRATLLYGGREIELHYLGRSHSDNMIVAYLPDAGVAFAVDFVSKDRVGYRDLPGWHFPDHFEAMERLQALDYETIAFGHGPHGGRAAINRQMAYYNALRAAVQEAVDAGLSEDAAAERVRLPQYSGWDGYENWFPLNVRGMYRWLAGR